MPKCEFSKVQRNFIEISLRHGCSPVNLRLIFRTFLTKNTSGRLLLFFQNSETTSLLQQFFIKCQLVLKIRKRVFNYCSNACVTTQNTIQLVLTFSKSTIEALERGVAYSKSTIKTPGRRHWRCPGVFIGNFEHISQFFLVFLLLNLNK